jgi:hypothetical protein
MLYAIGAAGFGIVTMILPTFEVPDGLEAVYRNVSVPTKLIKGVYKNVDPEVVTDPTRPFAEYISTAS